MAADVKPRINAALEQVPEDMPEGDDFDYEETVAPPARKRSNHHLSERIAITTFDDGRFEPCDIQRLEVDDGLVQFEGMVYELMHAKGYPYIVVERNYRPAHVADGRASGLTSHPIQEKPTVGPGAKPPRGPLSTDDPEEVEEDLIEIDAERYGI